MRLFERNIFVIETFALSPLIPELYWFSWESLWSIFWLWSMVLLAYLLDDSLMWADFQVYIKDASFREEHFCHWNFRSISSHSWVVLILVRKPLEYKLIMIHGPSSLFIGRFVDVSWLSSLYKRCVLSRGTFLSLKLSLYLLSFLSCIDSRWESLWSIFWLWSMVLLAYLLDDSLINKLEGPWIIIKKYSKGFLTRINTTQEWEETERKFQWQKCSSRKDASFI